MRRTLIKTAFNTVIYDVHDFGISIYDEKLDLIAEARGIPSFLGANDFAIKKAVEYVGSENLEAGDILIMNYPYWNSAHTYDATIFAPIFFGSDSKEIIAYEVVRAHWMDLGAKNPGSVLDSTDMYQEGVIFPSTKVFKRGEPNKDIIELMKFNSRMPEAIIGDLNAQVSSIRTGEKRLHQIFNKFGKDVVRASVSRMIEAGEQASIEALAKLPHGSWSAEDYLDDDGITTDLIPMKVRVTIDSESFKVDFTGSSGPVKGPVNLPFGAAHSNSKIVFKSLTTPFLPSNAGNYRPLKVEAPPGSLFHALPPAPTFLLRVASVSLELIYKAVAQGIREVSASSGGDNPGFSMIGINRRTGRMYWISNNEPVGWGAAHDHDGGNALQHHSVAIGWNTPTEVLESRTGMLVERLELITDSGGPGQFRGGLGVRRDIRFVEKGTFTSMIKKSKTPTWGQAGGLGTDASCMYIYFGSDKEKKVGMYRFQTEVGDKCSLRTGGGGGYGLPESRSPELVLEDILDGYVSVEAAKEIYKVSISERKIDRAETDILRGN